MRSFLLSGVVVATVATSAPMWSLDDRTEPTHETLAPGEAREVTAFAKGSHPVSVILHASGIAPERGTLRAEVIDPRGEGCSREETYAGEEGAWRPATSPSTKYDGFIVFSASCATPSTDVSPRFILENAGTEPIELDLWFSAAIGGEDSDTPDGAFVNVEVSR